MPVTTSSHSPRPLSDILSGLRTGDVVMTKAVAEEAIASVAADKLVTRDEAADLSAYSDGQWTGERQAKDDYPGWKQGSGAGRALFGTLATKARDMVELAERRGSLVSSPRPVLPTDLFNPLFWLGGAAAVTEAAPVNGSLLDDVRQAAMGWVKNSIEDVLREYPKATVEVHTDVRKPLPAVQAQIDKLKSDWLAGKAGDGKELASSLRTYLEQRYR